MHRPTWLPNVRHLLGEIPDHEVARRAGTVQSVVTVARRRLGIPAFRTRTLASYSPEDVVRLVRARSKRGESMRGEPRDDARLANLCRYHFGGWYQAVAAAGLRPQGKPRSTAKDPPRKRALTTALLQGPKSSAELERLTGVAADSVRHRRELLGIVRDERRKIDRSWLPAVRHLLGKVPDTEIAKRVGAAKWVVSAVRKELCIAAAPKKSLATSGGVREQLQRMSKRERRKVLATVHPDIGKIIEARLMKKRPLTFAEIGAILGISRQRVAQKERKAITTVTRSVRR